jgi:hypothetical protein
MIPANNVSFLPKTLGSGWNAARVVHLDDHGEIRVGQPDAKSNPRGAVVARCWPVSLVFQKTSSAFWRMGSRKVRGCACEN